MKRRDYSGMQFGRLLVLRNDTERFVICRCACGSEARVKSNALTTGNTKSCGCLKKEVTARRAKTHGHTQGRDTTPEYRTWRSMIMRCEDPENPSWPWYGGKGIKVCEQWRHSFSTFLRDMGAKLEGHSIERKDFNADYTPDNCRWIPTAEQHYNTRASRRLTALGKTMCVAEWAKSLGIRSSLIHDRIGKLKWPIERALTTPARTIRRVS